MRNLFFMFLLLSSCAAPREFKGTYGVPFETSSKSSFDTVWENIIDMFAKSGMGIKIIDRSSGFVVAQNASTPVTYESKKTGKPGDPNAWAITQGRYIQSSNKFFYPKMANVEWNIHIKKSADSTTLINVNLNGVVTYPSVDGRTIYTTKAYSTGVFERIIADRIK